MVIRRSDFIYKCIRAIGYPCFHLVYRLQIRGQDNIPRQGPGVLLPKHQFWTDIPIVGLAAWKPVSYIAKRELFAYAGVRHFLASLGGIPLDRGNPVKSLDSFRTMDRLLKDRDWIVVFPEGTYYPHAMGRGKYRLIQKILHFQNKAGSEGNPIPFVPIGIRYLERTFRTEVRVNIGRPLYSNAEENAEEFTGEILKEIARLSELKIEDRS